MEEGVGIWDGPPHIHARYAERRSALISGPSKFWRAVCDEPGTQPAWFWAEALPSVNVESRP